MPSWMSLRTSVPHAAVNGAHAHVASPARQIAKAGHGLKNKFLDMRQVLGFVVVRQLLQCCEQLQALQ